MQRKETPISGQITELSAFPSSGRLIAIDPGTKRVGVAISDETQTVCRPLQIIPRSSWKKLLGEVGKIISEFDAVGLVIGLPLGMDGEDIEMTGLARDWARKFRLSLSIPVALQDERVTSYAAKGLMWARGVSPRESVGNVDSEAAVIILSDFIDRLKVQ